MSDLSQKHTPHLLIQHSDHIATLTLNRPEARNAYSEQMIDELVEALDELELNPSVRVLVLTGSGSAFSAGGDLKLMRDKQGMFEGDAIALSARYQQHIQRVPRRLSRFSKPIIAAINGPAIGAGLDLAAMCDLRVASTHARFGSTFVKVGLVPGDGGAYFLSRAIGTAQAMELMLTGRVINATEAERVGLVSRVVEPEVLISTAMSLAKEVAVNAPVAVQLTKRLAYQSLTRSPEEALSLAASAQGVAQNTSDHLEGVEALLARRAPEFVGR
jgi:enoyl-CoA hydratase/carnithine racemase